MYHVSRVRRDSYKSEQGLDRRKFLGAAAATAVPGALLVAGCGSGSRSSVSVSTATAAASEKLAARRNIRIEFPLTGGSGSSFFEPVINGAKQAATDLGVQVNVRATPKFDVLEQARLVTAAVASKPTGIVTHVVDVDAMRGPVTQAVRAGIAVVVVLGAPDVNHAPFGALTFIGQNETLAGQRGGEQMRAAGANNALILNHDLTQVNLKQRSNGFQQTFGGQTKVIPVPNGDPTGTKNRIVAALESSPAIDAIFALGAVASGEPALLALAELGKSGKVKLGSFDISPKLLDALQAGTALFCIDQQQYLSGYTPIEVITQYVTYDFTPVTSTFTGPSFITKTNAGRVKQLSTQGIR
jgi:simple sugar transport system substrate-binding protein